MLKAIVLAGLVGICVSFTCDSGEISKVGCMRRNSAIFTDMLANNRDSSSSAYIGESIKWKQFDASLSKLACECSQRAKAGGYIAFALGFFGECHATKDKAAYENWITAQSSASNNCIKQDYSSCDNNDEKCVGKVNAEYVYAIPSQAPEKINGGFSEWSEYTECSASCGDGFKERERLCNNPAPKGGDDCAGELTNTVQCKIKECPVNGGYDQWSAYGPCDKSCGSGSKSRTRACTSPAPANGGANCNGDTLQSLVCNTQPCLSTSSCKYSYTGFNDDGDGKPVYFDRHTLNCPSGQAMNEIILQRNSGHNKIRFRYKCCTSQLSCTNSRVTNGQTSNGGGDKKKVYYLDRQTIDCSRRAMSYLKLDRNGDNWNYKYDCCSYNYASATTSCDDKYTSFSYDGKGKSYHVDRHNINCRNNYFITYMKMERNSDHNKIRYRYKCCKVNTPSATNKKRF